MTLASLRCGGCGSEDVALVDPGTEEVREFFLLVRERPMTARCLDCWTAAAVGRKAE